MKHVVGFRSISQLALLVACAAVACSVSFAEEPHNNGTCLDRCGSELPVPMELPALPGGGASPSGECWCDGDCLSDPDRDCCPDWEAECSVSGSCENSCGDPTVPFSSPVCGCDVGCVQRGDCCPGFASYCWGDSCNGYCGFEHPNPLAHCSCEPDCRERGDCCDDFVQVCDSCAHNDRCDPQLSYEKYPCDCDPFCADRNNCCDDYAATCQTAGCIGYCGAWNPEEACFCDDECLARGDCCSNFPGVCPGIGGAGRPSCADSNRCRKKEPLFGAGQECYCDSYCIIFGDCCDDYFTACSHEGACADSYGYVGDPPNHCGLSARALDSFPPCFCDEDCVSRGDCCADYGDPVNYGTCHPAPSCDGFCGGQAPEGCGCDYLCEINGDCCPDYQEVCSSCRGLGFNWCDANHSVPGSQPPCYCDELCVEFDDCCFDMNPQCDYIFLTSGSCAGANQTDFCGQKWKTMHGTNYPTVVCTDPLWCEWPLTFRADGCSCAADCAFKGNCCPDVDTVCNAGAPLPGSGEVRLVQPVRIASQFGLGLKSKNLAVFGGVGAASTSFAGLTSVEMRKVDAKGEHAHCHIAPSTPIDSVVRYWTLNASTDADDIWQWSHSLMARKKSFNGIEGDTVAECGAAAVTYPAGLFGVSNQVVAASSGDGYRMVTIGPRAGTFPLLVGATFEDLDDPGESGICRIIDSGGNWVLQAHANDDADAWCYARYVDLNGVADRMTSCSGGATNGTASCSGGLFSVSVDGAIGPQASDIEMFADLDDSGHYACFLNDVTHADIDKTIEPGLCEIELEGESWWLRARARGDQKSTCAARCLRLPSSTFTEGSAGWPARPDLHLSPDQTAVGPEPGPGVSLFVSADGGYDKPIVVLEGFDYTNSRSVAVNATDLAGVLQGLTAAGYDVWIVDFSDGGQPILESAREVAIAIDLAYKHQGWNTSHPGGQLVLAGTSMGGLAGRVALASWEAGLYNCSAGPECIEPGLGDGTSGPPVKVFVSVNAPQHGANIPVALQALIQDYGAFFGDQVRQLVDSRIGLNSGAARDMLLRRVEESCTTPGHEACPLGGELIKILADYTFTEASCPGTSAESDAFFAQVNARNGNGYPTSPYKLALSNGSWAGQSCQSMTDPSFTAPAEWIGDCKNNVSNNPAAPFTTQTNLLELQMVTRPAEAYGGIWDSSCERSVSVDVKLSSDDLVPGDLLTDGLDELNFAVHYISTIYPRFRLDPKLPFVHIPTASALGCPGGSDSETCADLNRTTGRFDRVAPNPEYNGPHKALHPQLAQDLVFFLLDFEIGDGDGHCAGAGCFGTVDCAPADPAIHPGALEVCDGEDNDCDGQIDEELTRACSSACGAGEESCIGGNWDACTAPQPAPEMCDGEDNDCDGDTDEGCQGGGKVRPKQS